MYKPSSPFTVPAQILKCSYTKTKGVNVKTYTEGEKIFITARSFGGTEVNFNGTVSVRDTMEIDTWYVPELTAIDRIKLLQDGSIWEIVSSVENIEMRNKYMKFKIERVKGGA